MRAYQSGVSKLSGSNYGEVRKRALGVYKKFLKKTRRRPYVRSAYFEKEKVFLEYFWPHVFQKNPRERFNRLKYFEAALDLIENSKEQPTMKVNQNNKQEILYRFAGITREKEIFYVQIKENKKIGRKYFMSCFSPE